MRASNQGRSIMNGDIVINGLVRIPVSVHILVSKHSFSGSWFHEGCHGRIKTPLHCEMHPEIDDPEFYTAIQVNEDGWVRIDSFNKKMLLGRGNEIQVVSVLKLNELLSLMNDDIFVISRSYEINPQKEKDVYDPVGATTLASLFDRLRVKKIFLLVKAPFDGMERYAIVLPNGTLHTLLYEEEIRERIGTPNGEVNPRLNKAIDQILGQIDTSLPPLTMQPITRRFIDWLKSQPVINPPAIVATSIIEAAEKIVSVKKVARSRKKA